MIVLKQGNGLTKMCRSPICQQVYCLKRIVHCYAGIEVPFFFCSKIEVPFILSCSKKVIKFTNTVAKMDLTSVSLGLFLYPLAQ